MTEYSMSNGKSVEAAKFSAAKKLKRTTKL